MPPPPPLAAVRVVNHRLQMHQLDPYVVKEIKELKGKPNSEQVGPPPALFGACCVVAAQAPRVLPLHAA